MLAGGGARRFGGRPKGLERVGGERILDRVIAAVSHATGAPPLLIANASDAPQWRTDVTVIPDAVTGRGTLGGIYTAVTAGAGPVLVVAWDMPFVPVSLLRDLIRGSERFDAFLPESGGRRGMEPLCAVYGPACGPAIAKALQREDYRAIAFHDDVRVGTLPFDAVATHGPPEELFFNVNTAEELARAEAMWRTRV